MNKFILTILMGNAAMLTQDDVAVALEQARDGLERGFTSGALFDVNGNRVGGWTFS